MLSNENMQNFQMKLNGYRKKSLLSRICYTKFHEAWTKKKYFVVAQKQIKPHTLSYLMEVIKLCMDEYNSLTGFNFSTFFYSEQSFCVDSLLDSRLIIIISSYSTIYRFLTGFIESAFKRIECICSLS